MPLLQAHYWLHPVLDDGRGQDQTKPSCKEFWAYVSVPVPLPMAGYGPRLMHSSFGPHVRLSNWLMISSAIFAAHIHLPNRQTTLRVTSVAVDHI